jgi:sensor histidine kinase YesM
MGFRMGERLQVALDLPDELRELPVPPLLLQPLVENAIRHGLEPSVAGGRLSVSARRVSDVLQLTVRDTGVGFGASPVGDGTRFGLEQVRGRLATLYGTRARFSIAAADDADGGTLAVIELPLAAGAAASVDK